MQPTLSRVPKGTQGAPAAPLPPPKVLLPGFTIAEDIPDLGEPQFLWRPYIPYGAVTLLVGPGGVGKSTIACQIAADLSQGRPLPGHNGAMPPVRTLLISAEDHASYVLRPKLLAAGANMGLVGVVSQAFSITPEKMEAMANTIDQFGATVVWVDPIVAYIGAKTNTSQANEVRPMLNYLADIASRRNAAVVVIHHTRKTNKRAPEAEDIMGSVDFVNMARSVMLVYRTHGQRVLKHVKYNWTRPGKTLAFDFDGEKVTWTDAWDPDAEPTLSRVPKKTSQAKDLLYDALTAGPVPAKELLILAKEHGVSESTLARAKSGWVEVEKRADGWWWKLKEEPVVPEAVPEAQPKTNGLDILLDRPPAVPEREIQAPETPPQAQPLPSGKRVIPIPPEVEEALRTARAVMDKGKVIH